MYAAAMGTEVATSSNLPTQDFKTRATNCVLLTVTVICICILVACGVMIVREYALAKSYEETTCQIKDVTRATNDSCRYCADAKDKSKEKGPNACHKADFPCVKVTVTYDHKGRTENALLHIDSIQAVGAHSQCSFDVCMKRYSENKAAVDKFAEPWEAKQKSRESFQCFYDTFKMKDVITEKKNTKSDVVHSMLWPSIVIIICGTIFLRLEMRRRGLTFWGTGEKDGKAAPNPKPKYGAENNTRNGKGAHQTLLQTSQHCEYPKCKLLKNAETPVISSSLSDLDRIKPLDKRTIAFAEDQCKLSTSISADRLQNQMVNPEVHRDNITTRNIDKFRQDSAKSDSPTGSQGSRAMGMETPV